MLKIDEEHGILKFDEIVKTVKEVWEKYNVDGLVVDVILTFVKVENWDKTIVTIPAYLLVSDSFTNWRNVFQEGGRRIKRSINIDSESVKVIDDELFNKLLKVSFNKSLFVI